jgi:hypothetical protein
VTRSPVGERSRAGFKNATLVVFKTDKTGPVYRGFRAVYHVGRFSRFGFIEKPVGYPYRAAAVRSVTAVTDRFTAKLRTLSMGQVSSDGRGGVLAGSSGGPWHPGE